MRHNLLPALRKACLLLLALALAGCAGTRPPLGVGVGTGYCQPPLPYRYDPAFAPQPDFEAALTPALLARYPRRNLLAANAAGLLPLLHKQLALEAAARRQPGPAAEVAVLRQRLRIQTQVALVSAAIASVAAELDCEGERANQVANYLKNRNSSSTQRFNVLSISVGAIGNIGTTVIGSQVGQYAFGVGGSVVAAGLGLLTLRGGRTVEFHHPRNLLAEVWTEKKTSEVFPPSVWYLLTEPAFTNDGQHSLAHSTRRRWQRYGQLDNLSSEQGRQLAALLFGPGGLYSADQLAARADMLNELQAAVRLLNQELQGLLLALSEEG